MASVHITTGTLFKPKVVHWRLKGRYRTPDRERVTKNTPGAVKETRESKKWYGRYRDAAGNVHRVPLSTSKPESRKELGRITAEARLGIDDPYGKHRRRPLLEHLEDYRRDSLNQNNTIEHVSKTVNMIAAIAEGCHFASLGEIEADRIVEFLAALRKPRARTELQLHWYTKAQAAAVLDVNAGSLRRMARRLGLDGEGNGKARRYSRQTIELLQDRLVMGASITTSNHYLIAIKSFTRWLCDVKRIQADPIGHLSILNNKPDIRRRRRALPQDELSRFLQAAEMGKPFRGLAGHDRFMLYALAATTGFRASELASLTLESFKLDGLEPKSFKLENRQPLVIVKAAYSKHRREDRQPLRPDVVELLRAYLAELPASRKTVWPGTWRHDAAEMIRVDLQAAGIPYEDADEKVFDFHALRHQFVSDLVASGASPKVAMTLARHSTITLTMNNYCHLQPLNAAGALEKMGHFANFEVEGKAKTAAPSQQGKAAAQ